MALSAHLGLLGNTPAAVFFLQGSGGTAGVSAVRAPACRGTSGRPLSTSNFALGASLKISSKVYDALLVSVLPTRRGLPFLCQVPVHSVLL